MAFSFCGILGIAEVLDPGGFFGTGIAMLWSSPSDLAFPPSKAVFTRLEVVRPRWSSATSRTGCMGGGTIWLETDAVGYTELARADVVVYAGSE